MTRGFGTPASMRAINEDAALRIFLQTATLTRSDLAARVGLSRVTAGQLITSLMDRGLVIADGDRAGSRGPSATVYRLDPRRNAAAGVRLTPRWAEARLVALDGTCLGSARVDATVGAPADRVVAVVRAAAADAQVPLDHLQHLVIGAPGIVDHGSGRVPYVADLPGLEPDLGEVVSARLDGVPVTVENDANMSAVAELHHDPARGERGFFLLWLDDGVGLALVHHGEVFRGWRGGGGEIGYLPVIGARLEACGRARGAVGGRPAVGGFQQLVGADAVVALAARCGLAAERAVEAVEAAFATPVVPVPDDADLARLLDGFASGMDAAGGGQPAFAEAFALRVALGVVSLTAIIGPGEVVLGGPVGRAGGARLADAVERWLRVLSPLPAPVVAGVVVDSVVTGAALAAAAAGRQQVLEAARLAEVGGAGHAFSGVQGLTGGRGLIDGQGPAGEAVGGAAAGAGHGAVGRVDAGAGRGRAGTVRRAEAASARGGGALPVASGARGGEDVRLGRVLRPVGASDGPASRGVRVARAVRGEPLQPIALGSQRGARPAAVDGSVGALR